MTAVLFDLDGTLIDSLPTIRAAANAVLAEQGVAPLPADVVAGFVGRGEEVFVDRLIATTGLEVEKRPEILASFMGHYKEEARTTRTFDGVLETLSALKAKGIPLGLVTNKPRVPLDATLVAGGLSETFDVVVAGDDLDVRKPDPLPLRHAMTALSAATCVYVGDSETDAATAVNASVPFVLFTEGIRISAIEDIPYDHLFSDFSELPALLERLLAPDLN